MKKVSPKIRFLLLLGAAALLALTVYQIVLVRDKAADALLQAQAANNKADEIPFTKTILPPLRAKEIEIWQSTQNVRAVTRFNDSIFAATDGGLKQISLAGDVQKHYTVLDGLPESDLTALAVFNNKLFIGTSSSGLLAFDGTQFENYRWRDREAKSVTALLAVNNRLLVGTFAGGLIEFDGGAFRELKPENQTIKSVYFLAADADKNSGKIFVGTFDNGLWVTAGGRWRHFTTADGLASNRIVGVVSHGETVFVGSDTGIARAAEAEILTATHKTKIFHPVTLIPALSGLTAHRNQILASRDDGKIFAFSPSERQITNVEWNLPPDLTNARLSIENEQLWLVGTTGVWRQSAESSVGFSLAPFGKSSDGLTSNIISALAVDAKNRVWAGTFRRGIDVLGSDGKRLAHLENENLREINFLTAGKNVIAATAHGSATFDDALSSRPPQMLTKNEGLLSNAVMHVAAAGDEKFYATSRGLSFTANKSLRGLTNVNGLPSSNVYAALFHKNQLFVGTLGGLAQIENGRVVRTFQDSNSKLTNNWVSALCAAGERLFVGTYGGGVLELTAAGELHPFAAETGKFAVNPNAMWSDGERLYVGTLAGAYILDLTTQKWTRLTAELPAQTVLSVTGDAHHIYFGTTNGAARIAKIYFQKEQNDAQTDD